MITALRTDLNRSRDASRRFLPWIIAFMVFLAALALAAAMVVTASLDSWGRGLSGTLTVQVPPTLEADADTGERVEAAMAVLRATPGVDVVHALSEADSRALLEPWFGADAGADLPLPRLIDVRLRADTAIAVGELARRLDAVAPGAIVDDHGEWLKDLAALGNSVRLGAAAVVFVIGLAAVLTVVYATRSGVAVHHATIELLHLMGARNAYIARQFERPAFVQGLAGGAVGLAAAALVLAGVELVAPSMAVATLPSIELRFGQWLVLLCLPLVAGLVAMAAARFTVLHALSKMV